MHGNMKIQSNSVSYIYKPVHILFVVVISGLLSSCAMIGGYTTPSYFEFKEDTVSINKYSSICPDFSNENKDTKTKGLNKKVCEARAYAYFKIDQYKGAFKELKTTNTFLFDLPMIGLAAATGATAIFSSNTDLIAGLALGTAGTTGLRSYFNNNCKATYYFTAESEAQCVVNNSFIFTNADGKKEVMDSEIKKIDNAIIYSRTLSTNEKFEKADLKVELLEAIKTADSSNALGNKSIRTIEVSNEIIINSINNIDLKLRGTINNDKPNLDDITSKISSAGQAPPPSTDTEKEPPEPGKELVAPPPPPPPPADPCKGRKNEPKFCNCKNLEEFKANQLDANQYALYCILELERISTSITDKANDILNFSTAIENCPKGS